MSEHTNVQSAATTYPCSSCGAKLEFAPGTTALTCPYCGLQQQIGQPQRVVEDLDFYEFFAVANEQGESEEKQTVACSSCHAVSTVDSHLSTSKCPFCGSQLTAEAKASRLIKPGGVLPFTITRERAAEAFRHWLAALWFAPGGLKRDAATSGGIRGMYIPAWVYKCRVTTEYTGERGDDYQHNETYESDDANGRSVSRTRTVTQTRWEEVGGQVVTSFDDLLVMAGCSLPVKILESLQPWDLKNLVPYSEEYVSGFQVEAYQLDLGGGFEQAKNVMEGSIRRSIERHIGGNHQRITAVRSQYDRITFKHILLPVWISAYRYQGKSYRFIVNARSGQVQGERPWSLLKISLTVIAALFVVAVVVMVMTRQR